MEGLKIRPSEICELSFPGVQTPQPQCTMPRPMGVQNERHQTPAGKGAPRLPCIAVVAIVCFECTIVCERRIDTSSDFTEKASMPVGKTGLDCATLPCQNDRRVFGPLTSLTSKAQAPGFPGLGGPTTFHPDEVALVEVRPILDLSSCPEANPRPQPSASVSTETLCEGHPSAHLWPCQLPRELVGLWFRAQGWLPSIEL